MSDFDSSKLPKLRDVQFSYLKCVRIFHNQAPHKNTTSKNEHVGIKLHGRAQSRGANIPRVEPIEEVQYLRLNKVANIQS